MEKSRVLQLHKKCCSVIIRSPRIPHYSTPIYFGFPFPFHCWLVFRFEFDTRNFRVYKIALATVFGKKMHTTAANFWSHSTSGWMHSNIYDGNKIASRWVETRYNEMWLINLLVFLIKDQRFHFFEIYKNARWN